MDNLIKIKMKELIRLNLFGYIFLLRFEYMDSSVAPLLQNDSPAKTRTTVLHITKCRFLHAQE